MKEKILSYAITKLVSAFLSGLSAQQIKVQLDHLIDHLEDLIQDSSNNLDNSLLPVIKFVRDVFDIPDYPDQIT